MWLSLGCEACVAVGAWLCQREELPPFSLQPSPHGLSPFLPLFSPCPMQHSPLARCSAPRCALATSSDQGHEDTPGDGGKWGVCALSGAVPPAARACIGGGSS